MPVVLVLAAALLAACAPDPPAPVAAAKTTEAWGFDFRIRIEPNLTD